MRRHFVVCTADLRLPDTSAVREDRVALLFRCRSHVAVTCCMPGASNHDGPSALGVLGDDMGLQALSFALLVIALAAVAINEVAGGGATQSAPQTSAATDGQYSSSR
jgi:hypothetical protein